MYTASANSAHDGRFTWVALRMRRPKKTVVYGSDYVNDRLVYSFSKLAHTTTIVFSRVFARYFISILECFLNLVRVIWRDILFCTERRERARHQAGIFCVFYQLLQRQRSSAV